MPSRITLLVTPLLLACLACSARVGHGQTPQRIEPRAGLLPQLPLTPELPPRPLVTPDQPWAQPTEEQGKPTSSFIDSLKGNDAAIEVVVGQGRLLTLSGPLATEDGVAVIAVGDPTIVDFEVLPDQRMLRLTGRRVGVTDMSFVTADGRSYSFEVHVGYDLILVTAQLKQIFPDALIKLHQLREHVVVEGQARSPEQVQQILNTITSYLTSVQTNRSQTSRRGAAPAPMPGTMPDDGFGLDGVPEEEFGPDGEPLLGLDDARLPATEAEAALPLGLAYEGGARPSSRARSAAPQLINLLRVPGSQQVMLKVTIAELNRTAFRAMGVDLLIEGNDLFFQSLVAGTANVSAVFGDEVGVFLNALRNNSVSTILAEPNLVTLSGYPAQFQVGGEFAVPVTQFGTLNNTIEFKPFGVQLLFLPYIQDDGVIRLTVRPEVSNPDDTLGTQVVGTTVPGIRTRNASTTVELREGQTLAMAGLLNRISQGNTDRIPWIGDLPVLGNVFRNTDHEVQEIELLVLVTPQIVGPLDANQCIPLPGQEIGEPCDLELYLLGRIEGRTGLPYRATTNWDDPLGIIRHHHIEKQHVYGDYGFSK